MLSEYLITGAPNNIWMLTFSFQPGFMGGLEILELFQISALLKVSYMHVYTCCQILGVLKLFLLSPNPFPHFTTQKYVRLPVISALLNLRVSSVFNLVSFFLQHVNVVYGPSF